MYGGLFGVWAPEVYIHQMVKIKPGQLFFQHVQVTNLQSQSRFNTSDKIIILILLFFIPAPPNVLIEKPEIKNSNHSNLITGSVLGFWRCAS